MVHKVSRCYLKKVVIDPTISSYYLYQKAFLSRLLQPHVMGDIYIGFISFHFVAQPTALCYITCVWLAFWRLWLRNNPTTTSTPACNLWKKTIAHLRLVILNKCSNLGIWSTKRVFHWNFISENLENGTSGTEVLWDNF